MEGARGKSLLEGDRQLELGPMAQPRPAGCAAADSGEVQRLFAKQREEMQELFSGFVGQLQSIHARHLEQQEACLRLNVQQAPTAAARAEGGTGPRDRASPPSADVLVLPVPGRRTRAEVGATAGSAPSSDVALAGSLQGQAQKLVRSAEFNTAVSAIIVLNVLSLGMEVNHLLERQVENPGRHMGDNGIWKVIENFFTLLLVAEVTLRMMAERQHFFQNVDDWCWNCLDLVLAVCAIGEGLMDPFGRASRSRTLNILRLLRFARVLRVVRLLSAFHSFRIMMNSIAYAVPSLTWAFVVLVIEIYAFSMFFSFGVVEYLRALDSDTEMQTQQGSRLVQFFGSLPAAMCSLFMAVSGGVAWDTLAESLAECGVSYKATFVFYVFVTTIGILNIVTGIFVDSACLLSLKDRDVLVQYEVEIQKSYADKLKHWFQCADKAVLSWEDFAKALDNEQVKTYFAALALDITQARTLYELLDVEETNEVAIDAFVDGCMRLKGAAQSVDVAMLGYKNEKMFVRWNAFMQFAETEFVDLRKAMGSS